MTGSKEKLRLKHKMNDLGQRKVSTKTSTRGESNGKQRIRYSAGKFTIKKGNGEVSPQGHDEQFA